MNTNKSLFIRVYSCAFVALFGAFSARAAVDRVVIIKVDGLPERLIERYASETAGAGHQGHSRLPWIQHVFGEDGTWFENFYVRGLSLSSPSWSLLDTGRHLEIHGNAEYDRYTLRVFDYMNFFPFYVAYARNHEADMPGVTLLDENHVPLLIDRFPEDQRYQAPQLYQRSVRWQSLESGLMSKFTGRPVKDVFDEWVTGFSISSGLAVQTERELLAKLRDPNVHYLDFYATDYDHTGHLTADPVAQLHVIEAIDSLIGRIWTAIEASPLARTTMMVVVSDHGMNTEPGIYSQGYSLIDWLNSTAGGAHHVLSNRHPMTEFKLKGLDPFVSEVISPSSESTYLAGQSAHYPTAVVDLDGNERASISLRSASLNIIQILLDQLIRKKPVGRVRAAAINALFQVLDRVRPEWLRNIDQLNEELLALRGPIEHEQQRLAKMQANTDEARRASTRVETWKNEERTYNAYITTMRRLLSLDPADFDPGKFTTFELIPRRSLGEPNSIRDLQHYPVGLSQYGLVIAPDGSLDWEQSFRYIDYFSALGAIRVRNNVQKDLLPQPVDFIAAPVKTSGIEGVWLWDTPDHEALILTRHDSQRRLQLRYMPVANLTQDAGGGIHYDPIPWCAGLPLQIFEDPDLDVPGDRQEWLNQWHDEREWLRAVHRTRYSNGIIGIIEEFSIDRVADAYLERKRELRRVDMIAFANDHWNFNVRGFNPGGNHGSFLRVSTNSVLLAAGGDDTGIPRGLRVTTPYDSLSVVPTILMLLGKPEGDLPGPIIEELFHPTKSVGNGR